eukprot:m.243598 g.243598  ORF g.243598 m.243598 type:complete len:353 (-) comp10951_c1_seq1:236-1294(-)
MFLWGASAADPAPEAAASAEPPTGASSEGDLAAPGAAVLVVEDDSDEEDDTAALNDSGDGDFEACVAGAESTHALRSVEELCDLGSLDVAAAHALLDVFGGNVAQAKVARLAELGIDAPLPEGMRPFNMAPTQCPVCFDDLAPGRGVCAADRACDHALCSDCLARLVQTAFAHGETALSCPSCPAPLADRIVRDILGPEAMARHEQRLLEEVAAQDSSLVLCPTPDCTYMVVWERTETDSSGDGADARLGCPQCSQSVCLRCRGPSHPAVSCADNRASAALDDYVASAGIRKCPRCKTPIEKSDGCDKMKCRCGFKFCYACGTVGATCACTPENHGYWDNATNRGDFTNDFE